MQTFQDRFILNKIAETGLSQDKVVSHYQNIFNNFFAEGRLFNTDEKEDLRELTKAFCIAGSCLAQCYNMSPDLLRVLRKTKAPIKMKYIFDRVIELRQEDYIFTLNMPKYLSIFHFGNGQMIVILLENLDLSGYKTMVMPRDNVESLTVDECIEKYSTLGINDSFVLSIKSFAYIIASGKPDLREFKNPKKIKSEKRIKRANRLSDSITERIDVGFGFAKERIYVKDSWEIPSHFRYQPYGPKGNPTHYELISVRGSNPKRKIQSTQIKNSGD